MHLTLGFTVPDADEKQQIILRLKCGKKKYLVFRGAFTNLVRCFIKTVAFARSSVEVCHTLKFVTDH
jgi:hypothetical protein